MSMSKIDARSAEQASPVRGNATAPHILLRVAAIAAVTWGLAACRNLDLGDNPRPDVPKTDKSFTMPPAHLQNGGSE
jgi:hypothetical protein